MRQEFASADQPRAKLEAGWIAGAQVATYRAGQTIVHAGADLTDWIAISSGAANVRSKVAGQTSVAVATLWLGDVVGWGSPIGKFTAFYDITATVDMSTVSVPRERVIADSFDPNGSSATLFAATAARLHTQLAVRLAGNGFQKLVSVLARLIEAFSAAGDRRHPPRLALPVAQSFVGQLAGLSRRQTWIYLGQLAEAGWIETARTKVVVSGVTAWLHLQSEVMARGLECIADVESFGRTMAGLGLASARRHEAA